MKKLILAFLALSMACMAAYVTSGFGKKVTATTTPTVLNVGAKTSDYAEFLHVTVTSGEVRLMLNCTTNNFVTTNGLVVTTGFPQTFWSGAAIKSICHATESGEADVIFNFQ